MVSITLALALTSTAQGDPVIDGPTLFASLQRYQSSFHDVTFIQEGTLEMRRSGSGKPDSVTRFQTFFAYRKDGATLLDAFSQQADKRKFRLISSILHGRVETLNATPDDGPPVRSRDPESRPGGPGSLLRYDSPERIFLAWYFSTLAEAAEYDFKALGWEDVDGHRCLRVSMLRQPKPLLKGWPGGLPYVHLWIDPRRDSYPVRYEYYQGADLETRVEITRMERLKLPDDRSVWFPAEGKTWGFLGRGEQGERVYKKEPTAIEAHVILIDTVKFDQGLNDSFFSVRKHALVASDEGLRKLQRELEIQPSARERLTSDPESRRKRLDAALDEANRQAEALEASSAARASSGWFGVLTGGMGLFGVVLLCGAAFWYRKNR